MNWPLILSTCKSLDLNILKPTHIEGITIWPQNKLKHSYSAYKARQGHKIAWFFQNGNYMQEHYEDGNIIDKNKNIILKGE